MRLLDVQEYLKEDLLTQRNLLYQLGLEGGGPHPTSCPKPVQNVMERDGFRETSVQKAGDRFPNHFFQ